MITRALLFVAGLCIRVATRRYEAVGPLPWTDRERERFDEGFKVGVIHGETIGYRKGHSMALGDMLSGDLDVIKIGKTDVVN